VAKKYGFYVELQGQLLSAKLTDFSITSLGCRFVLPLNEFSTVYLRVNYISANFNTGRTTIQRQIYEAP